MTPPAILADPLVTRRLRFERGNVSGWNDRADNSTAGPLTGQSEIFARALPFEPLTGIGEGFDRDDVQPVDRNIPVLTLSIRDVEDVRHRFRRVAAGGEGTFAADIADANQSAGKADIDGSFSQSSHQFAANAASLPRRINGQKVDFQTAFALLGNGRKAIDKADDMRIIDRNDRLVFRASNRSCDSSGVRRIV